MEPRISNIRNTKRRAGSCAPRSIIAFLSVLTLGLASAFAQTSSPQNERGLGLDVSSPSEGSETATDKRGGSTGRPQLVFQTGHTTKVDGIAFSQDGRWLATGSLDNTVKLWDADAGRELRTLKGHTSGVTTVSFAPAGGMLASGS